MKSIKNVSIIIIILIGLFITYSAWAHDRTDGGKLLPKINQAPEFTGLKSWINSPEIKSMRDLRGKVILIDFWTFGCINCILLFASRRPLV